MTTSLTSFIIDQFGMYGLPNHYVHTISRMLLSSDIVTLAIRLALVSIIVSHLKSWITRFYRYIYNSIFVTVHVANGAADWIRGFCYQDPEVQAQLKQFRLIVEDEATGTKKAKAGNSLMFKSAGATFVKDGVCFRATPWHHKTFTVTNRGRKIWLTRSSSNLSNQSSTADHYIITTYTWNRQAITDFILDSHKVYHEKDDSEIHIFNHTPKVANWEGPVVRPGRSWSSVILPGTVKDDLLKDVKDFVSEEEKTWYASRGIPHRRGYLLHGPPGTGKTTLATALASKLNMDLYIVNPAAPGMDNGKLQRCFRTCPKGSLLLIEDIDCVMPQNRTHRGGATTAESDDESQAGDTAAQDPDGPSGAGAGSGSGAGAAGKHDLGPSSVTLSGLLNAIDGVASQEDSVLFASTNYPNKLDEALRRPGRFDVHVPLTHATSEQARDLYKHFYPPSTPTPTPTPSTTIPASSPRGGDITTIDEKTSLTTVTTTVPGSVIDQAEVDRRADQFAEIITKADIRLSIAVIQGFLLLYKKDPIKALEVAQVWVEGIRKEQQVGQGQGPRSKRSDGASANHSVRGGDGQKAGGIDKEVVVG